LTVAPGARSLVQFPDLRAHLSGLLRAALAEVAPGLDAAVVLERPRNRAHGDFACNVAMQVAKALGRPPRAVAQALIESLPASPHLARAEVAGPGFINLGVAPATKRLVVHAIRAQGADYGRLPARGESVLVEYVSANPTGPLHVGHGRGAAYGASLANVLEAAGFEVQREFYVNDAGRQMDILALSTWLRYLEESGVAVPFPPNAYQGEYVRAMAQQLAQRHGRRYVRDAASVLADTPGLPDPAREDRAATTQRETQLDALIANAKRLLGPDWASVGAHALAEQLADCRDDLTDFGVTFDQWFSEHSLYETGLVERALAKLEAAGHLYEQDGALWFRSTAFGDEKDRVVRRENGQPTYFASDIAYHLNKFERGFDLLIDVWGADHHGYIARVRGALSALGLDAERLVIALVQFAVLYRGGHKVPMSTRAGQFVTLRELRDEVGNDAARFFYVLRKSDQHLDFDLDLARSRTSENPVYYIQYAHARVCSVFEQWGGDESALDGVDLAPLSDPREAALLERLAEYPEAVRQAALEHAPHGIAFYLKELAAEFHGYYNAEQFLVADERLRLARLALVAAVRQVVANALALLGVSAPRRM
jgi:arginyl-tRNA synthetase